MATAYEISFKHEVLNEFIAGIDGFFTRNFLYTGKKIPENVAKARKEMWDIYEKLPFENDMDMLEKYDKRLFEIRDFIKSQTASDK